MPPAGKSGFPCDAYLSWLRIFSNTLIFLLCFIGNSRSQDKLNIEIQNLQPTGILLDKGWKFCPGDNPDFSKPEFDDSNWETIDPTLDLFYLPNIKKEPVGWFRIKFTVDSSLLNKPLAFKIYQSIASQVYLDGKLIIQFGTIGKLPGQTIGYRPNFLDPGAILFTQKTQVIAVRFAVQKNLPYTKGTHPYFAFRFRILDIAQSGKFEEIGHKYPLENAFWIGIFLTIASIHFGIFLRYKTRKADLYFSLAMFVGAAAHLLFLILGRGGHTQSFIVFGYLVDWILLLQVYNLFLFLAVLHLFPIQNRVLHWIVTALQFLVTAFFISSYEQGENGLHINFLFLLFLSTILAGKALRRGDKGAIIVVVGFAVYLLINGSFILFYSGILKDIDLGIYEGYSLTDLIYFIGVISVPICLSLYLARDFAMASRSLENKLKEVQLLSDKTITQEKEKQEILAGQKDLLELQVRERTMELQESLESLKAAQAQLIHSEKMASLGELTAGIAHEIQNPLNFVNNFSEVNAELIADMKKEIVAGNYPVVKQIADDLEGNMVKITEHGKRADLIVKSMLQHSRTSKSQKEITDINSLVDEYVRLAFHGIRAKEKNFNAKLSTNYDPAAGSLNIIPQDIGRVLLNLLNNAFYAVNEKKTIIGNGYEPAVTLETRRLENGVEIRVSDNGNGIPQQQVDKIFQPFFTTKPTGQGTGLGLSLSYDIVKAHGGEIKLDSQPGNYSEFTVWLPVVT